MSKVKKQFENTVDNGEFMTAEAKVDVPEGKQKDVKVTKFEESHEDENGNIIVTGRIDEMPKTEGHAHAKVVKQFDDSIDHGTYIEAVPKPDFAKD